MPYLRIRGSQLAIVHGEREPGNPNVQQRILFTIYSQAEALEILGRGSGKGHNFEMLLEHEYPELRFNWKKIRTDIESHLAVLPETYENGEAHVQQFRKDLCAFTRSLALADPQTLLPAAQLIQQHRHELEYLQELIQFRLECRHQEPSEYNQDNPFHWRSTLQGRDVPMDAEEDAEALFDKGEYEKAAAIFRLLIDSFQGWAEGYNYLGLIAYEQRQLDEARAHFEKTIETGRKLFPARLAKKWYWRDHKTRPYMRGLRNLVLTLNEMGRYEEALTLCGRLVSECGDDYEVAAHQARIYLNTRQWAAAAEAARLAGGDMDPGKGFLEAFARFELGQAEESLELFLRAALQYPRAARMLTGLAVSKKVHSSKEARDHNAGVTKLRGLREFLRTQPARSKKFFRTLLQDARVTRLLEETREVEERRNKERGGGGRKASDRLRHMHSGEFAHQQAQLLSDLLPGASRRAVLQ